MKAGVQLALEVVGAGKRGAMSQQCSKAAPLLANSVGENGLLTSPMTGCMHKGILATLSGRAGGQPRPFIPRGHKALSDPD